MTHSFGSHTMQDMLERIPGMRGGRAGFTVLPAFARLASIASAYAPTLKGKASDRRSTIARRFTANGTRAASGSAIPRAGALALGAAAMYWLDPANGRARRARTVDHLRAAWTAGCELADKKSRHLRNRAQGALAELAGLFRGDHASDDVVQARIRAELGTIASRPSAIGVRADRGKVELTGSIDPAEHDRVIAAVRRVRGVRDVVDRAERR